MVHQFEWKDIAADFLNLFQNFQSFREQLLVVIMVIVYQCGADVQVTRSKFSMEST